MDRQRLRERLVGHVIDDGPTSHDDIDRGQGYIGGAETFPHQAFDPVTRNGMGRTFARDCKTQACATAPVITRQQRERTIARTNRTRENTTELPGVGEATIARKAPAFRGAGQSVTGTT